MPRSAAERRDDLVALYHEARGCPRCPLSGSRTQVVFGNGNADADLMFVGEAPGFHEDAQGVPFVGRAGRLLDELLGENGMTRGDVFVTNVLKCLRYTAQVQLADGSWERIGRLVRSRYSGAVKSVSAEGRLVPRRVIGWHASPVAGRSVYRLTYRSAKRAGPGRVGIELTGDHPVLTARGFVAVQELRPGDRMATGQGLSTLAHDVVCGTLLGDGCIKADSSHLTMAHSQSQLDYARFKRDLLAELSPRVQELDVAAVAGGSRVYPVVHVRTLAHRALRILREDFYRPTKRVPAWLPDALNERMLAMWFMDDGHMRIRSGGRSPLAEIATNGFAEGDLQVLLRALCRQGLVAKASPSGRLYFDVPTTKRLSELIAPYVPQSMRYKLHPEVERRTAFDPGRLRREDPKVLFDEIDVEDVTKRARTDRTFFCIDVEETHNFVTAGGVVRNCRPPDNRDPLPVEIETCRPYLQRQVELIEPKVICTLGNFATKLLTGSGRGISQAHGQSLEREVGGRAVRLYPLFHPAAALRTPRVKEQLREDFRRLPALLAASPAAPLGGGPQAVGEDAAATGGGAGSTAGPESRPAPRVEQLGLFG